MKCTACQTAEAEVLRNKRDLHLCSACRRLRKHRQTRESERRIRNREYLFRETLPSPQPEGIPSMKYTLFRERDGKIEVLFSSGVGFDCPKQDETRKVWLFSSERAATSLRKNLRFDVGGFVQVEKWPTLRQRLASVNFTLPPPRAGSTANALSGSNTGIGRRAR